MIFVELELLIEEKVVELLSLVRLGVDTIAELGACTLGLPLRGLRLTVEPLVRGSLGDSFRMVLTRDSALHVEKAEDILSAAVDAGRELLIVRDRLSSEIFMF